MEKLPYAGKPTRGTISNETGASRGPITKHASFIEHRDTGEAFAIEPDFETDADYAAWWVRHQ